MIYAGKQITSVADPLTKISLDYLYNGIRHPKSDIESKIRQLRLIRDLDKKRYGALKKELPYLVCGTFNPPFRRTDNFAFIEYFIIDIDHIAAKGLSIDKIRLEMEKDARTVMSFLSPGEDGLKVMFRLKERCYDHGLYSLFYKMFARSLSETYQLEQVLDTQVSDVCRACFVSCDPNIYFNPNAERIDLNSYVDINNPLSFFDLKKQIEKSSTENKTEVAVDEVKEKDPDTEAIQRIKEILKLKVASVQKTSVYVPQQLHDIIENIKKYIEETGIQVTEIINISYGKKIRMQLGVKQAEINIFYGKRGYSVVKSPRCGTSRELNDITSELIHSFFAQ